MKNTSIEYLRKVISLDLRALATMRIGIAFTILIDIILRLSDLEAHYTDNGVLPLEALFKYLWDKNYFSIYTISNSWHLMAILFFINIFCACCLLFGYKTKFFTVICWVFLLSLHNRNPLINQGGDDLLRLTLFIGIFLPWGYCYSLDTIKNINFKSDSYLYLSVGGFAYILQIICMYVFSALLKSSPEWTTDFTALYYALSLDQILLPFGNFIFPYYNFLLIITFLVYHIELLLPFALIVPFFNNYFRICFFVIMTFMHIGIFLSLNVGLFPLISIVCTLGILPSFIFNELDKIKLVHELKMLALKMPIKSFSFNSFPRENFIQYSFMIFFSICILVINLETIKKMTFSPDGYFNKFIKTIRIDQHWAMFAPSVFKDDGWFILLGKTDEGKEINIHENVYDNKVNFNKPVYVAGTYKNDRWRKYSEGILMVYNDRFRPYYCSFLINKWNREHIHKKVKSLEIIYMKERSLANYEIIKPQRELLCNCSVMP